MRCLGWSWVSVAPAGAVPAQLSPLPGVPPLRTGSPEFILCGRDASALFGEAVHPVRELPIFHCAAERPVGHIAGKAGEGPVATGQRVLVRPVFLHPTQHLLVDYGA